MQPLTNMTSEMSTGYKGLINRLHLICQYSVEQQTINIHYRKYFHVYGIKDLVWKTIKVSNPLLSCCQIWLCKIDSVSR